MKARLSAAHTITTMAQKTVGASLRDVWIGVSLFAFFGAAFTATVPRFFSNDPGDVPWKSVLLKLGYSVWLFAYFFFSNRDNEADPNPTLLDIVFDVFQSGLSIIAAAWMGLIFSNFGYHADAELGGALKWANGAIALICLGSFAFVRKNGPLSINILRACGFTLAGAGFITTVDSSRSFLVPFSWVVVFLLSIVLVLYASNPARGIGRRACLPGATKEQRELVAGACEPRWTLPPMIMAYVAGFMLLVACAQAFRFILDAM